MTDHIVFTLTLPNGDTFHLDYLGILFQISEFGDYEIIDILHWTRVDKILAVKTPKRAENLIRMARKTNYRKQRQYLRQQRAQAR